MYKTGCFFLNMKQLNFMVVLQFNQTKKVFETIKKNKKDVILRLNYSKAFLLPRTLIYLFNEIMKGIS